MASIVVVGEEEQANNNGQEKPSPAKMKAKDFFKTLTLQQTEEVTEAFDLFDKDGDGNIDSGELRKIFRTLGQDYTEAEMADMMAQVDEDNNGELDFYEFGAMLFQNIHYKEPDKNDKKDEYAAAFKVFDTQDNG